MSNARSRKPQIAASITALLDQNPLSRVDVLAARRRMSMIAVLSEQTATFVRGDEAYNRVRKQTLALLDQAAWMPDGWAEVEAHAELESCAEWEEER